MKPLYILVSSIIVFFFLATTANTFLKAQPKENSPVVLTDMSIEEQQYYQTAYDQITADWSIPSAMFVSPEDFVDIVIKVRSDGVIIGRRIEASSGHQEFNLLALRKIANSAPLPTFPETVEKEYVNIGIRFTNGKNQD